MGLSEANQLLGEALQVLLPDLPEIIVAHALLIGSILVGIVAVLLLCSALFFDFIADAWKIPLGIGVDLLKYYALTQPWVGLVAGIAGAALFIGMSDARFWRWPFAALSLAAGVLTFYWNPFIIGVLIGMAPISTVLIFISAIID